MADTADDWTRILDQLLAGDRLAFLKVNRLITAFLSRLGAYDLRQEWDDLRQEVVLSVVANARAGRLRDPQAFAAYVRTITHHKFADRIERGRRTREGKHVEWNERDHDGAAVAEPGDGAAEVWFAVADLPAQERIVIDGVYKHGKTYEEVAEDTGIPLGTVKRRLRDGLDALRRRFGEK
jgi:RNA polymerase sigma-70 factor, ECF subfamily